MRIRQLLIKRKEIKYLFLSWILDVSVSSTFSSRPIMDCIICICKNQPKPSPSRHIFSIFYQKPCILCSITYPSCERKSHFSMNILYGIFVCRFVHIFPSVGTLVSDELLGTCTSWRKSELESSLLEITLARQSGSHAFVLLFIKDI